MSESAAGPGLEPVPDGSTAERIFAAATHVFARKGRDGARMQEIADHADINRALLHYYFRTKHELYEAVFTHGFHQFISGFAQALRSEQTFAEALRTFVHGYIDYVHDHQDMARLMLNECLCEGSILQEHLSAAMEDADGFPGHLMEERLRAGMEAGEVREVDPKHTMLTLVSACLFSFVATPTVRIFHPQVEEDFDGFVEARKRHIVDLLLNGLEPASAT